MYQPGALRHFLEELGIHPRKGLSQNFLIDGNIIRKIVQAGDVQPGEFILEIGPGPGALTEALLQAGAEVLAVEKDPVLAKALARFQVGNYRLKILCDDALKIDIEHLFSDQMKGKVIANLPYHITTPLLAMFLPLHKYFSHIEVMVQDEVARRLTAKPSTSDYSSLTVFANFYSDVEYAFKVSKNCFYPVPNVDSAVVIFKLRSPFLENPNEQESFFKLTRTAFCHRRKMLRASLKDLYGTEQVIIALTDLGLNPQARPEELSVEEFIALFHRLGPRIIL